MASRTQKTIKLIEDYIEQLENDVEVIERKMEDGNAKFGRLLAKRDAINKLKVIEYTLKGEM